MDDFRKYLNQYRCAQGVSYTHTVIKGTNFPGMSLHIPNEKYTEFIENYTTAYLRKVPLYFTEKPTNPSPMRCDLDFRFILEGEITRKYKRSDIEKILNAYTLLLNEYLDIEPEKLVAYVMEKPQPVEYRGKVKDGIHIVWPDIVISHNLQHLIRKRILDEASNIFSGIITTNTYDDIVDQAIIDRNNWQMYGSCKPESSAYAVSCIYNYDKKSNTIFDTGSWTAENELKFIKKLSMRRDQKDEVHLKKEKISELEDYTQKVLPSIDERKKSKLMNEVFGKSQNLTKNIIGDDDLLLAKQLVEKCLKPSRRESYDDWIKLGWTLRNIDYRLIDTWIEFSKVSGKYIEGECQKYWNRMRTDTLGMGTLRWWARTDNLAMYNEIIDTSISDLIDISVGSDGAHFDVARVVHGMFKDRYRFTTKDIWYKYDDTKHKWIRSKEGLQLRLVLSYDVCNKFLARSIFWNEQSAKYQVSDQEKSNTYQNRAKKLTELGKKLKNSGYKDSVLKECKGLFTDEKFEEMLDSHSHLIGFENGVYDLRMHEFRDGLPDDYISFTMNRHYVGYDSNCQEVAEIKRYLSQVFTNENVRDYVLSILACMIDGSMRQEKFYIFTGSGSNSKSAILNFIQKCVGDYYCILPISLLTQKRAASNSAQSELERTKGRRFAIMQEPSDGDKINIGLMKELSGGDRIQARGLYKEPIEFRPQFKMIMTCNELPEIPSDDGGTWRRIRVIEFTSKFTDKPDPNNPKEFPLDPELLDKFDRWADVFIGMLIDLHKNIDPRNINEPMEVRVATEGYKKNNDIVGQFINDRIIVDKNCKSGLQLIKTFNHFKTWAQQFVPKGKKVPDRNQLKAYIEKLHGVYPLDGKGWRGIKYVNTKEVEADIIEEENKVISGNDGENSDIE